MADLSGAREHMLGKNQLQLLTYMHSIVVSDIVAREAVPLRIYLLPALGIAVIVPSAYFIGTLPWSVNGEPWKIAGVVLLWDLIPGFLMGLACARLIHYTLERRRIAGQFLAGALPARVDWSGGRLSDWVVAWIMSTIAVGTAQAFGTSGRFSDAPPPDTPDGRLWMASQILALSGLVALVIYASVLRGRLVNRHTIAQVLREPEG